MHVVHLGLVPSYPSVPCGKGLTLHWGDINGSLMVQWYNLNPVGTAVGNTGQLSFQKLGIYILLFFYLKVFYLCNFFKGITAS